MISTRLAVAIFAFTFIVGGLNSLLIFDTQLPSTGVNITEDQIRDLSGSVTQTEVGPLFYINLLIKIGGAILMGLLSVLTIIPFLMAYGIGPTIGMIFQGPIWFVYALDIFRMFTGHATD